MAAAVVAAAAVVEQEPQWVLVAARAAEWQVALWAKVEAAAAAEAEVAPELLDSRIHLDRNSPARFDLHIRM